MKCSDKQMMSTRKLTGLPNNPRKITQENLNRLCDSIRDNGFWSHRPCAVEWREDLQKYVVLDGNQRLKAARRLKMKEIPVVIYSDLDDIERDDIILRSNINNGEWDTGMLQADYGEVDFESIGLEVEMPEAGGVDDSVSSEDSGDDTSDSGESTNVDSGGDNDDSLDEDKLAFFHRMLGDFLYPSNNEFEIPTLLSDNQPVHLELPFTPWGVEGRYKKGITTYHFYVDDYRFEQLFKNPILLLQSGCRAIVEPNCSIHDQTPVAYAIYQIYRKRYLARYLQECGMQIWVDLNVSHRFAEYNLMGVPEGYNAFFTRGVSGWQPHLELNLEMAQRISGCKEPNMYVYGGGKDIEAWCQDHGIRYLAEFMSHLRNKKE